jgi:perosamine synthetase
VKAFRETGYNFAGMDDDFLPVAAPVLAGNEQKYVLDCLESSWISSTGAYIGRFEQAFADFCGVEHAVSCTSGTTGLHLSLLALGVGPGDEILLPTLTFAATANAVRYCGATPVFVDSHPATWTIDPDRIADKIGPRTSGIIVVHLFGHPGDMDPIQQLADRHGLFILEDAAQAHGAEYRGRRVGSLGRLATFSFFGNKIITTGEGGMVTTSDADLAARMRLLKSHGMDPTRRYWFPVVGYNYRMTNVAAAIGLAQLEKIDWHLARRREVAGWYLERMRNVEGVAWQPEQTWARHVWWMFTVVFDDDLAVERDTVTAHLAAAGIDTRPMAYPLHQLPPYQSFSRGDVFPNADRLARRGVSLPTSGRMTREDVTRVCDRLEQALHTSSSASRGRAISR